MDSFFPIGIVKEEGRGEKKFKVFKIRNYLFPFTVSFAIILSIFNLKMFYFSRRSSSRSFYTISLYYLAKRVIFAFAFIILSKSSFFWRNKRSISALGGASSQKRLLRKHCSQYSDRSEITQRKSRDT